MSFRMFSTTIKAVSLAIAVAMTGCATVAPLGTPSGRPEVSIASADTSTIRSALLDRMLSGGYTLENETPSSMTFSKPMSDGDGFMYQALLGNAYSSAPSWLVRINLVSLGGNTRVLASIHSRMQNAFGREDGQDFSQGKAGHEFLSMLKILKERVENAPAVVRFSGKFDEQQARKLMDAGPNTIMGKSFIVSPAVGTVTCQGRSVRMIPVTEYSRLRIVALYGNDSSAFVPAEQFKTNLQDPENDAAYKRVMREANCDAQGNFRFQSVADGEFFLFSGIGWGQESRKGGFFMQRVAVHGGRTEIVEMVRREANL